LITDSVEIARNFYAYIKGKVAKAGEGKRGGNDEC
jgi:hypothetical protein